ncbi:MAG: hypothetical protein K5790_01785 [Nitrosopumilus sp.]|uniref:hypothetical protein n=1 Tax=Nitrosopumilus sp. TaxID=2024843 RepID=UPI00247C8004|nr:hypothetical protein [Nitrosopumilus sp.]MCV0392005.1 hypothetical protein [Nitrosopumilus sp.]
MVLGISIFTLNTSFQNDSITWITLVLSLGSGIIITLIVNDKAKLAHQEVITSQQTITDLLEKLEETDKKHQKVLKLLQDSTESNEQRAKDAILINLIYIKNMLEKIFKHIDKNNIQKKDFKLITDVLKHLESSIDLTMQSLNVVGVQINENKKSQINSSLETLRKIIIASLVITDENWKKTGELLHKSFKNFEHIVDDMNN